MSGYQYTKAYSERGADMGRSNRLPVTDCAPIRMRLERVRLDSGGYDPGGAYWGRGPGPYGRLYVAWLEGTEARVFVRAESRWAARDAVSAIIPNARFYR